MSRCARRRLIRARPGLAAIVCLGVRLGADDALDGLGPARPLRAGARLRRRPGRDRPVALGDQRQGLDRRPLLLGQVARGRRRCRLPLYLAIEAARRPRSSPPTARRTPAQPSTPAGRPTTPPPLENYGYDPARRDGSRGADRARRRRVIWALTLLVAVIPAVLLLLGVRWVADRLEPGYGTAAAVTLGLGTIVMIFASEYFSHVISAALGFARLHAADARARGRAEPEARRRAPGCWRGSPSASSTRWAWSGWSSSSTRWRARWTRPQRGLAYVAGGAGRGAPGARLQRRGRSARRSSSPTAPPWTTPGFTGHDTLGLNDDGFFGITAPRLDSAVDLLVAGPRAAGADPGRRRGRGRA